MRATLACRGCGGDDLLSVIDLGVMPLVNTLPVRAEAVVDLHPLAVALCRGCALAQLTTTVAPATVFDGYPYLSSVSRTMVRHAESLVARFVEPGHRVIEIGCNDGYLLAPARHRGADVLGIDPARRPARRAVERGVPVICTFFDEETARRVREERGPADLVFALNVLAHVPDPDEIAAGLAVLLAPGGRAVIEVPSWLDLVDGVSFDTIYHEHCSYFSATALAALCRRHELAVVDAERIPGHGGSLRIVVARDGRETAMETLVRAERDRGLLDPARYRRFAARVGATRAAITECVDAHGPMPAYGAAAKGVVLLNACGLGSERITRVADANPAKQGRYVPGTGQAIVAPSVIARERPERRLLLPWNLEAEIRHATRHWREGGTRFLRPLPTPVMDPVPTPAHARS